MQKDDNSPERETLWKQYALHVDLYKFYLDIVVKVTVFYYAITGAILTYYFQHTFDGVARFALLLPFVFSLVIGCIFFWGALLHDVTRTDLFALRDKLGLDTAPEIGILRIFLFAFGSIMILTGIAILVFFFLCKCYVL
jgi:hypothetical protein